MATEGGGSRKRLFQEDDVDEFESLNEVHACKSAKVHGVLTSVSPMKSNRAGTTKYFDAQLTDGKKPLRIVGFDTKLHQRLVDFYESKDAVALTNCEIKEGKYSSALELVLRKSTQLQKSPVKFDVDNVSSSTRGSTDTTLGELDDLCNFQKVDVGVKVIDARQPVEVKKGLVKQEYVVEKLFSLA